MVCESKEKKNKEYELEKIAQFSIVLSGGHTYICQLCLIHARPRGHLVMLLVPSQCVHLQLVEIDLWQIGVSFIAVFLRILSASLRSCTLDATLVKVAYVKVWRLRKQTQTNTMLAKLWQTKWPNSPEYMRLPMDLSSIWVVVWSLFLLFSCCTMHCPLHCDIVHCHQSDSIFDRLDRASPPRRYWIRYYSFVY